MATKRTLETSSTNHNVPHWVRTSNLAEL